MSGYRAVTGTYPMAVPIIAPIASNLQSREKHYSLLYNWLPVNLDIGVNTWSR